MAKTTAARLNPIKMEDMKHLIISKLAENRSVADMMCGVHAELLSGKNQLQATKDIRQGEASWHSALRGITFSAFCQVLNPSYDP